MAHAQILKRNVKAEGRFSYMGPGYVLLETRAQEPQEPT